jgi:hypothetical protein
MVLTERFSLVNFTPRASIILVGSGPIRARRRTKQRKHREMTRNIVLRSFLFERNLVKRTIHPRLFK